MNGHAKRVLLLLFGAVFGIVVSEECVDLLDRASCRLFGGCKWSSVDGCRACTSLTNDPYVEYLCTDTCVYDVDAGCGPLPEEEAMDEGTFAPTGSAGTDTNVVEGVTTIETSSSGFGYSDREEFEEAMAQVLGADAVYVDEVETETCGEAPLCGDDPQMVEIVNDWRDVPIPELAQCCAINDTRATETCQANDPSVGHCRYTGVAVPFCDTDSNTPAEECNSYENFPELTIFRMSLAFQRDEVEVPCCLHCSCYGDPNCVSFNGSKTSWRLCDGRDTSKSCQVSESACRAQKDHMGNNCKWKQKWSAFWKDGSPCQPDVNAEDAWLLMYEADSFLFEIRQEERGVIREVKMITASGTFSMDADACLSGTDFDDTWTYDGPTSNPPDFVSSWKRIKEPGVFDVMWFIFDENTAIQAKVRCTGTKKKSQYGNLRLNVEALVEPIDDFMQVRTNVNGFCATGDLTPPGASTSMTESYQTHLAIDAVCENIQVLWDNAIKLEIANLFCGDGQTLNTLVDCWEDICARFSFPHTTYSECLTLFKKDHFDKGTCSLISSSTSAQEKCMDDWAEFGHEPVIQNLIDNYNSGILGECISNINDLPTELSECESGVTLQAQQTPGDDSSWVTLVAIPESVRLCGNELDVLATETEWSDLFTKPLRFQQCSPPLTCNSVDKCVTESGIDAIFRYDWFSGPVNPNFLPTPSPTPAPTVAKPTTSDHPTPAPTRSPTLWPSKVPTGSPTPSPSLKSTPSPTNGPTKSPTGSPTRSPTETDEPTKSPTKSPTQWPTKSPTKSPIVTGIPTTKSTPAPTNSPTESPTQIPTRSPTESPTKKPTGSPTKNPTKSPTRSPTEKPTRSPTKSPTRSPTVSPTTSNPTKSPTRNPTKWPSKPPSTAKPTSGPTSAPTYCTPECPALPPTPEIDTKVDRSICSADITFSESDLTSPYCGCDFTNGIESNGEGGMQVDLSEACPQMWVDGEDSGSSNLEITCQTICYDLDSPSFKCDAWELNWDTGICSLFSCDAGIPKYTVDDCCSSGEPCGGNNVPSLAPTLWRVLEVVEKDDRKVRVLQERPVTVEEFVNKDNHKLASLKHRQLDSSSKILKPRHKIRYFATFTTAAEMSNAMSGVLGTSSQDYRDALATDLRSVMQDNNIHAKSLSMGETYKVIVLEFPQTPYDGPTHNDAWFLSAVCYALQNTIDKETGLTGVKCNRKLFVMHPYGTHQENELRIPVRIMNTKYGKVQWLMARNNGKRTFKKQLKRSSNPDVKVLTAGMPDYPEDETGVGIGLIAAISVGCLASVLIGAAVMKYRKRTMTRDDQLWNMIHHAKE